MASSTTVGRNFGPYLIIDRLGKGASATVFVGERSDGERVAVKVLSTFAMGNADFRRAVAREFDALNKIDHPGVISVAKMGTIADILFIEMEWVDGPTIADTLSIDKPLPLSSAATIGVRAAEALQACHDNGVIHRDVKPSNILLREPETPVLFDFGLALDLHAPDAEPGRLYATPMTASPEQVLARGPVDGRADVYALGVTLYRLMTGRLPFYGERMDLLRMHVEDVPPAPSAVAKGLLPEIDALLLKALEKDPDDRYQSAAEFGDAIAALSSDALAPPKRGLFRSRR